MSEVGLERLPLQVTSRVVRIRCTEYVNEARVHEVWNHFKCRWHSQESAASFHGSHQ
jgi:hypothetical protein